MKQVTKRVFAYIAHLIAEPSKMMTLLRQIGLTALFGLLLMTGLVMAVRSEKDIRRLLQGSDAYKAEQAYQLQQAEDLAKIKQVIETQRIQESYIAFLLAKQSIVAKQVIELSQANDELSLSRGAKHCKTYADIQKGGCYVPVK